MTDLCGAEGPRGLKCELEGSHMNGHDHVHRNSKWRWTRHDQGLVEWPYPEPYASLVPLRTRLEGWFSTEKQLDKIFERRFMREGGDLGLTVIELGSWLGSSTAWFAKRASRVYAVDTWEGSLEIQANPKLGRELFSLYAQFLSNMIHEGVADVVTPVKMRTSQAAVQTDFRGDLVFVDADHETESVLKDVLMWWPRLNPGGIMCGDDWSWPSVVKGVEIAASLLQREIRSDGNLWWLEGPK